jgi:secretion/DNA translocation related TadE-like protein
MVRWRRQERGSGSVLALAVVAALALTVAGTLPFALATPLKHRMKDAADAAALAAASAALGAVPGSPCELAAVVAEHNSASLLDCRVDGLVVTVTAGTVALGMRLTATSTAGPESRPTGPP